MRVKNLKVRFDQVWIGSVENRVDHWLGHGRLSSGKCGQNLASYCGLRDIGYCRFGSALRITPDTVYRTSILARRNSSQSGRTAFWRSFLSSTHQTLRLS